MRTKDYGEQYRRLWAELGPELERVFHEEDPVLGAPVARFEASLARYHGVAHAVGMGSGTDALVCMVRGLGLGPGDEVVTGAHTFAGVVSALVQAGVEPVLVDAAPGSMLVDAPAVERALSPRTRAVLAVHMYGEPVELDPLQALCRARGLILLEDAAQAHGARYRGRAVGGAGEAAALSFHPSKNLGAFGDGGAVLTSSDALAQRLRIDRNLGKDGKYRFAAIAPNSKLDTLQAAILEVKLRHLDAWVARRRALAARYLAGLAGVGDLMLPGGRPESEHAYHLFVVRTARRDALREHLAARDIQTGLHYPIAAARQPALAARFDGAEFPVADELARTVLSLPLSHEHGDEEIDAVIDGVRAFFASPGRGGAPGGAV
ncbi:MAG TPA: DegT/DnrJ/EryC1/StrS family aminotransferase [Kofleriaceae bacterium]|nr:DegT/DnrJ/EryC1/StrS family aminotransferase [Kofleriaceae bacterium]